VDVVARGTYGADTDAEAEAEADAEAEGEAEADAEAEAEAEAVGDELGDANGDADLEGDRDGDGDELADACAAGDWDADALVAGDTDTDPGTAPAALGDDDAIADGDTEPDADALGAVGRAEADAVGEEFRAACRDWTGALAGCPPTVARTKPATAATARSPPIAHASSAGRRLRRRGGLPPPGPGWPSTNPETRGKFPEVTISGLPAGGAQGRSSPPGTCAGAASAEPVAVPTANARMIDPGSQSAAGAMAPTSASRPSAAGR
jgi:hypothetical protein